MGWDQFHERLSKITTIWTTLREAHSGSPQTARAAQQLILQRYYEPARLYLLAMVRDPTTAEDLAQEFALGLLSGSYNRADPSRGRFRHYVKTSLLHLVCAYRRKQQRQPQPAALDAAAEVADDTDAERQFTAQCRDDLIQLTLRALAAVHPGQHMVFSTWLAHQEWTSRQLAEHLSRELGKPCTDVGVRQTVHRARAAFGKLLLDEVAASLRTPTVEAVQAELAELNLLEYVRPAVEDEGESE
jgi:RNA polymerase sigma-70 factor (ECF subfamily)